MSHVFVTGGTGFVGSAILKALADHNVTSLVRTPRTEVVPWVTPVIGDVTDPDSLRGKMAGHTIIVHLVGIIEESGGNSFDGVIRQGTANVVAEAQRAGVQHVVLMSALGARDDERFPYMRAKHFSELAVRESGIDSTILRPSVIFGPGDSFINTLAGVVRSLPVTPVVGDGNTRFSPVALNDVADAFAAVVRDPERWRNEIFKIGGGETITYEQMIEHIAETLVKKRPRIHVPVGLMKGVVALSAPLPKALRPPVTPEQLKMLAMDNSTSPADLERLIGRQPLSLRGNIGYVRS